MGQTRTRRTEGRTRSTSSLQSGCGRPRDVIVHCGLRFDRPNVASRYPGCLARIFSRWRSANRIPSAGTPAGIRCLAKKLRAVVKCAKLHERNTRLFSFAATQIFALVQIQERPSTKVLKIKSCLNFKLSRRSNNQRTKCTYNFHKIFYRNMYEKYICCDEILKNTGVTKFARHLG